jgi:hypothetical protein
MIFFWTSVASINESFLRALLIVLVKLYRLRNEQPELYQQLFATLLTLMLTPCLLILGEEIWGKLSVAKEYAYKILLSFKKYYKK